jgi:D-threo-aldose 1-dehydrogenase
MRSLEHSLQRLGTNAIDIVLIHDVNRRWQGDLVEQRYAEAMDGAHRALVELRAAGAIKAFGVGVNDWSILMRFAADGDFDCFMLAGRYTLLDHTRSTRSCPIASAAASRC